MFNDGNFKKITFFLLLSFKISKEVTYKIIIIEI